MFASSNVPGWKNEGGAIGDRGAIRVSVYGALSVPLGSVW